MSRFLTGIGVRFYLSKSQNIDTVGKSNYVKIPHVVDISDLDYEPEELEVTSYSDFEFGSSIVDGFGTSGVQHLTVISTMGNDAESIWNSMATDSENGSQIWLCISIPKKSDSTYIPICPIKTKANKIPFNDKVTTNLYYTINGEIVIGENPIKYFKSKTWHPINTINGGNEMVDNETLDISDINKMFNNIFYLKGN